MPPLEISPDEFRRLAGQVMELAAQYLAEMDSRATLPTISGGETDQLFHVSAPEKGIGKDAVDGLRQVMDGCRVQNGRFFGYVLGSGDPVAAVADMLASVLNQNVTAWRSSPAAATVERTVVEWLAHAIGCRGFSGSLTGGGSPANLMGLAMAREAKLAANQRGMAGARQGVIYASTEVHMSIAKSIALLGIGRDNLRLIATDDCFRMLPEDLAQAVDDDEKSGKIPTAIVASAGTVNTGAIDPLTEIAAIARRHNLWLHVDGAYGALAAMAVPEKFAGLNLADSISLDPHKWLYQPVDCGCLLYRDSKAAQAAFAHTGDYAKVLSPDPVEGFAFFEESLELSRRFRALKLWFSLRYHGLEAFREAIHRDLGMAQRLAAKISQHPELELMTPAGLSAVCFRYRGNGSEADLNTLNAEILRRLLQRGRVYLSNATLHGHFCLRACVVNHRTTAKDVDCVVEEVEAAAQQAG